MPNLNSSTGDKEKVAKVKKIYQNLNDAYGRATAVYGPSDEWFQADGTDSKKKSKRIGERMSEFMKVSKTCGLEAVNSSKRKFNIEQMLKQVQLNIESIV